MTENINGAALLALADVLSFSGFYTFGYRNNNIGLLFKLFFNVFDKFIKIVITVYLTGKSAERLFYALGALVTDSRYFKC